MPDEGRAAYEPPDVAVIGSLQTLTRGGSVGPGDSFGGAGSSGSL